MRRQAYSTEPANPAEQPVIVVMMDHDMLRAAVCDWVAQSFPGSRCFPARDGSEAERLARALAPTVMLIDTALGRRGALDAIRRVKATAPEAYVVGLLNHAGGQFEAEFIGAGASACVDRWKLPSELMPLLERLPVVSSPTTRGSSRGTDGGHD